MKTQTTLYDMCRRKLLDGPLRGDTLNREFLPFVVPYHLSYIRDHCVYKSGLGSRVNHRSIQEIGGKRIKKKEGRCTPTIMNIPSR